MGLNAALAMASRSLEVFTAGINVAGNNISNAQTEGYIREELQLESAQPFQKGSLIFGTGVFAAGVVQQIDLFLEKRVHSANSDFTAAEAKNGIYKQLEVEIGELEESDLSTSLDQFLGMLHNIVNQPESAPVRDLAIQEGVQFAADIADLRVRIDKLRQAQSVAVEQLVGEANTLINQITDLNPKIARLEASGLVRSEAGALRTLRYDALNRLSEIIPTRFIERKDGTVDVFSGSDFLIITGKTQQLATTTSGDRNVTVTNVDLTITDSPLATTGSGGELAGIIEGRDVVLGGFVDKLNSYTSNLINQFNRIHSFGEGLTGFSSVTADTRVTDATADLDSAGLVFSPSHGSFQLKVTNTLSGSTVTTNIPIDLDGIGTDSTLNSLQTALNAVADVSASITTDGRLKIDAGNNYEIRFTDDTSGVLASLGINTFFTGFDSSDIGVNSVITNDHRFFATSHGGGPSDGSNALLMAEFTQNPVSTLNDVTLDDFYEGMIANVAQSSSSEAAISDGLGAFRDSLKNQREQFSGVSLDEEAVKVLEFQRAFQASARLVSIVDELFTVLLSM